MLHFALGIAVENPQRSMSEDLQRKARPNAQIFTALRQVIIVENNLIKVVTLQLNNERNV